MFPVIEQHYKNHLQRLLKKMTFRAGDLQAAEDIIHESYYRAMKYYGTCKEGEFDRWFSTIINNTLRDYKREEAGRNYVEFDEEDAEGTSCPSYPEQVLREVNVRIANKPDVQREILELHYQQGFSPVEIAQITLHSYANSRQVINRFRNELKELYLE